MNIPQTWENMPKTIRLKRRANLCIIFLQRQKVHVDRLKNFIQEGRQV